MKKIFLGIIIVVVVGAAVYFGSSKLQKGSFVMLRDVANLQPVTVHVRPTRAFAIVFAKARQSPEMPNPLPVPIMIIPGEDHILALPHEGELSRVYGQNPCNLSLFGAQSKNVSSCEWRDTTGATQKSFGRYVVFSSLDKQSLPLNAVFTKLTLKVARISGKPQTATSLHVFTSQKENTRWEWNSTVDIAANEADRAHPKIIEIPIVNRSYDLSSIAVARNKDAREEEGAVYIADIFATYEYVPIEDRKNVMVLNQSGGKWQPGASLQEMLAQEGILVADITLADGKKITAVLGETKCFADGEPATSADEWAQSKPQSVVNDFSAKMQEIFGPSVDFGAKFGELKGTNKKFKICDNGFRCQKVGEQQDPFGAVMAGGKKADLFADKKGMGFGMRDERLMQDLGSDSDYEGYRNTSVGALRSKEQPTTDIAVSMEGPDGKLYEIKVTQFKNGAAQVNVNPYEHVRVMGGPVVAYVPNGTNGTRTFVGPDNKEAQKDVAALLKDIEGNPAGVKDGAAKVVAEREKIEKDLKENTKKLCNGDQTCIDRKTKEQLEEIKKELDKFSVEAGKQRGIISKDWKKMGPDQRRKTPGGLQSWIQPSDEPGKGAAPVSEEKKSESRSLDVYSCAFAKEATGPKAMPNPENIPQCQTSCPKPEMAVGHKCEESEQEKQSSSPLATCVQNIQYQQRRNVINCPEDNPDCAQAREVRNCADGRPPRTLCNFGNLVIVGCPETDGNRCQQGPGPEGGQGRNR